MKPELASQGFEGAATASRLRRELGLRCKQKRKFKAKTNSNHDLPVADNLLNQTFEPTRPNEAWVTDITYIATGEEWLYLAGIKDVFTCELVGYGMGHRMTQGTGRKGAVARCTTQASSARVDSPLRPWQQYCAHDYHELVKQFGMQASMSRRGNCYDNAPMESFWEALRTNWYTRQR